jgi:RNA polymerase sigma factor (sigma-70 family)
MTPDSELLSRYASRGDEAAFAEVVRRQVSLVYSVALRVTNGNTTLAEDVSQTVFTDLARKAGPLSHHAALAGWLHTSARFAALKAIRGEQRRQAHEKEASTMQPITHSPEFDWEQLRPILDQAVSRLREKDRAAVVLRFFQGLSHREVGEALGLNENTARKRVDHALEKLRAHFAKMGITVSSALLASTLSAHTTSPAPVGLADKITQPALAGAVNGGTLVSTFITILFMSTKTKAALLVILVAAIIGVIAIKQPTPATALTAGIPTSPFKSIAQASAAANAVAAPVPPKPAAAISPSPAVVAAPIPASVVNQSDLKSVLADMARHLRAGDLAGALKPYIPPYVSKEEINDTWSEVVQGLALIPTSADDTSEKWPKVIDTIIDQEPTLNSQGDHATYTIPPAPGTSAPTDYIVFIKIKDLWYLEQLSMGPIGFDASRPLRNAPSKSAP